MDVPSEWWKTFFRGLPVEVWHAAIPPAHTKAEADGLVAVLDLEPGARFLDAPCGSGRLGLELASRGHAVVGIDISPENIAMARASVMDSHSIEFHEGDMQRLPWIGDFDAAICMGNSFGYFDEDGNHRFVEALAAALRPGGGLVIDTPMMSANFEGREHAFKDWHEIDDYWVLSECRYDATTKRYSDSNVFLHGDRVERASMSQRVWDPEELVDFVTAAGFGEVRLCGDWDGSAWAPGAASCFVVARKPRGAAT